MDTIDKILSAYLETALWASTDESGYPFDNCFNVDDFSSETVAAARAQITEFYVANEADVDMWESEFGDGQTGHDFWLTRNRHGAGFWDRDYSGGPLTEAGERLTEAAHAYGEAYVSEVSGGKLDIIA